MTLIVAQSLFLFTASAWCHTSHVRFSCCNKCIDNLMFLHFIQCNAKSKTAQKLQPIILHKDCFTSALIIPGELKKIICLNFVQYFVTSAAWTHCMLKTQVVLVYSNYLGEHFICSWRNKIQLPDVTTQQHNKAMPQQAQFRSDPVAAKQKQ